MDASREVARRPKVPALALLGPWLALALVAAFRDGGSSDTGLTIAAVGAILACALALLLAATGRIELPRPTGAGLVALAGLGLWCAVAFASIAWSLSPADSWQDGIHVACAAAALAARHVDRGAAAEAGTGRLPRARGDRGHRRGLRDRAALVQQRAHRRFVPAAARAVRLLERAGGALRVGRSRVARARQQARASPHAPGAPRASPCSPSP